MLLLVAFPQRRLFRGPFYFRMLLTLSTVACLSPMCKCNLRQWSFRQPQSIMVNVYIVWTFAGAACVKVYCVATFGSVFSSDLLNFVLACVDTRHRYLHLSVAIAPVIFQVPNQPLSDSDLPLSSLQQKPPAEKNQKLDDLEACGGSQSSNTHLVWKIKIG